MHIVIRTYSATPEVLTEARQKLAGLEETMRDIPGFAGYYFVATSDRSVATITVADDERGAAESTRRAAEWVQRSLQTRAALGTPEVTQGEVLLAVTP